jgi:NAD(P)-dependent dehydrogenase (short-subunit alcohol dehydrogenase family)
MAGRLENKVAIVVGAGSVGPGWSNGKAAAALFAREGARVCCVDVSGAAAEDAARTIRDEGGDAIGVRADASKSDDLKAAVDACLKEYGRIDVLHNNVGIVVMGGVVELSEEDWNRAFDVNLKSCYLAMKHVIPHMVAQGGGSIVNVSSISSLRYLGSNYVTYYTTKAAMNHMTRVTAAEYASRQVRVNAVLPGLMDTPMAKKSAKENRGVTDEGLAEAWKQRAARIPMGWMGDAWDVARAALFLASDESRFITGVELVVDGGLTLRA